jgi:hypothetical protein
LRSFHFEKKKKNEYSIVMPNGNLDRKSIPFSEKTIEDTALQTNPFAEKAEESKPPSTPRETLFASVESIKPESVWSNVTKKNERYSSRLIGKGGEHLVFEFDDAKHGGVVHKINFRQTFPVLRAHQAGEIERKKALEAMEEEMVESRRKLKQLREYFGASTVPMQRFLIQEVPVTREVVEQLFPGSVKEDTKIPETLPAWGAIQRRLDLPPQRTISLNARYPEVSGDASKREASGFNELYDDGYDLLVGKESAITDPEEQRGVILDLYPNLHKVAEKIDTDPSFKAKLQETVKKMIAYSQDTMIALDLAGADNIVLVQGAKGWELKMPDPLPLYDYTFFDVQIAGEALKLGRPVPKDILGSVFNSLNTLRVINALALLSGVPDRLEVPSLDAVSGAQWRKEFNIG